MTHFERISDGQKCWSTICATEIETASGNKADYLHFRRVPIGTAEIENKPAK